MAFVQYVAPSPALCLITVTSPLAFSSTLKKKVGQSATGIMWNEKQSLNSSKNIHSAAISGIHTQIPKTFCFPQDTIENEAARTYGRFCLGCTVSFTAFCSLDLLKARLHN